MEIGVVLVLGGRCQSELTHVTAVCVSVQRQ